MLYRCSLLCAMFFLLSGCTLTSQKQHEETLQSINRLGDLTQSRQSDLASTLVEHQGALLSMDQQIGDIKTQLNDIQRNQARLLAKQSSPEVVVKEKVINVPVSGDKLVLGAQEWVWFEGISSSFRARIDTGAETSSLNAVDIQEFERDGNTWVRFNLSHSGNGEDKEIVEVPVERWVKIRQSSAEGTDRRPVIKTWIRLGNLHEKAEFTLADRTQMEFPILLGREFFKDIAVVDVSQTYIHKKYTPEKK